MTARAKTPTRSRWSSRDPVGFVFDERTRMRSCPGVAVGVRSAQGQCGDPEGVILAAEGVLPLGSSCSLALSSRFSRFSAVTIPLERLSPV